jgi:hypothetical protein
MSTAAKLLAALVSAAAAVAAAYVVGGRADPGNESRAAAPRAAAAGEASLARPLAEVAPLAVLASAPPAPRVEVAAGALRDPELPVRAHVVVRGELRGARGRGEELELRLFAYDLRELAEVAALEQDPRLPGAVPGSWPRPGGGPERVDLAPAFHQARRLVDEIGVSALAGREGAFARDVTDLVASARELPDGLLLTVRHENFRPVDLWIPLEERGRALDRERLSEAGEIELRVQVELDAVCLLRGEAWCFDAEGEVQVEVWSLAGGVPSALVGAARAGAAANGGERRWAVAVPPGGRYAVVALAEGYLPQTVIVPTWDQLDLWLGSIVLDRGVAIRGALDVARHSFGSSVALFLAREGPVIRRGRHGPHDLVWTGSSFEPEVQATRRTDGGRFEFTGLVPGAYRLRMGIDREWWTEMDPVIDLRAPAEALWIEAPLARVTLAIEQDGAPVAGRRIVLAGVGRSGGSAELVTDAAGRAEAWLFPGEPYVVHVSRPQGADWSYGKVVPWERRDVVERIVMGPSRGGR